MFILDVINRLTSLLERCTEILLIKYAVHFYMMIWRLKAL